MGHTGDLFVAHSIDLSVISDKSLTAQSVKPAVASLIDQLWGGQRALDQLAALLLIYMYAHQQPVH